jgi:transposase
MMAGGAAYGDLFWLCEDADPQDHAHFPLSHEVPPVDDQRVLSGILHLIRNGLRWSDAPADYDPRSTLYNRFIRWSGFGVFNRIFAGTGR